MRRSTAWLAAGMIATATAAFAGQDKPPTTPAEGTAETKQLRETLRADRQKLRADRAAGDRAAVRQDRQQLRNDRRQLRQARAAKRRSKKK